ncbi:hypothetical protein QBL02_07170 [Leucobacter sp. UT-8R-CII-1-4]|uniref:hypothetical protein n=1 Tax=Leucobacter sp. UT-8R-CII-1-4 TaxID=3040075 RepID=UPI0024A8D0B9|nr:hypothetical protein [Leucobacter sp. UT-8R-CII-1-4]MDI6023323.1 hypothetical protein [Leucobacter sp. UT-8R-CII-1-4]
MRTPGTPARSRARKDALAGEGPIVNRARAALKHTAAGFGTITSSDQTSVTVRSDDGIQLKLSYNPGNYIFSRVYNLKITTILPEGTQVPGNIELSFREKGAAKFFPKKQGSIPRPAAGPRLNALNSRLSTQLAKIDLLESSVEGRSLSLVPMGGSFVWVLIPPIFKATAFPAGEVDRLLELIRSFREPHTARTAAAA